MLVTKWTDSKEVQQQKTPETLCLQGFRVFFRVPRTGIEPALPCENQILSLARLPIPPSGLKECNITTKELYFKIVFHFLPTTRINFKFE